MDNMAGKNYREITVGLSHHRPEMIPLCIDKMHRHDAIILEEPPDDGFGPMLAGDHAIEEYVMGVDTEYPEFSRRMCQALRSLYREGKVIIQIEPYLEGLLRIHERFGQGLLPADIESDRSLCPIYRAEREATGALIGFYEAASKGDFGATLSAVKAFARRDAHRFLLRDDMRAESIAAVAAAYPGIYVEAGQMHVGLAGAIRRRVGGQALVSANYLMSEALKMIGGRGCLFAPGDILTLLYYFNPSFDAPIANLFAARALIQNKIVAKVETRSALHEFPHTRDELETIHIVEKLTLEECRQLLPVIAQMDTNKARRFVARILETSEGYTG